MLSNATLRRVDPPPGPQGSPIAVRCTLNLPTGTELRWMERANVTASTVLYVPFGTDPDNDPASALAVGGTVSVELDGRHLSEWMIVQVVERAGDVIRYAQVFLTAAG